MGKVLSFFDKLSNVMTGMGTTIDKQSYSGYHFVPVDPTQAEAAYRTSWLMRKIIDIPPLDMTRAWRSWQADSSDIEALEKAERQMRLREKCKRALVLSRLFGGGALVLGVKGEDPAEELQPARVRKDGLAWVHVFSRHQLTASGMEITDPNSPWFGMPEYFSLAARTGTADMLLRIHPSRVIAFVGQKVPEGSVLSGSDWFWGDPLYQSIKQAVMNADLAQDGFAALIDEASTDILKIPGLMERVGSDEYEQRLLNRLSLAKRGQSLWRSKIIDAEEDWEQRQVNWAGIPDIIASFLQITAGAADIPITRMLGTSPKGLQSNGDGEERDYHAMIAARQDELLGPALDRIDEVMIPSVLGSRPSDIWYKFSPLSELSPKDAAEIEAKRATTIKTYADTGLIETDALAEMAKTAITESGQWPGSEAAFEKVGMGAPEDEGDDDDLLTAEEREAKGGDRTSAGTGASPASQPPRRASDAAPRTLYVQRKLLNADEFIRWAKAQGFETTTPADDLHVTIAFSRQKLDWMKAGSDWHGDADGKLIVPAGGARIVEPLGDKGAVVLLFNSSALAWRHEAIKEAGASWDWPEYQPHVTITYQAPDGLDLSKVEPFRGALEFGPEIFAEVVEDWEQGLKEQ